MKIFLRYIIFFLIVLSASGCSDKLKLYEPVGCNFEVLLPGKPSRSTVMARPNDEVRYAKHFRLDKHRDFIEIMQVTHPPNSISSHNYQVYFDKVIDSVLKNVKGQVKSKDLISVKNGFGANYVIEGPLTKSYSKIYCIEDTVYFIWISTYEFETTIQKPVEILDSFKPKV